MPWFPQMISLVVILQFVQCTFVFCKNKQLLIFLDAAFFVLQIT